MQQSIQNTAIAFSQDWLSEVSLIGWGLAHPIWAIGGLAVLLFLLSGLLRAIAQLAEKLWVALLRSPLKLLRWLFAKFRSPVKAQEKLAPRMDGVTKLDLSNNFEAQIQAKILRLEQIQTEQMQLLQEVKALLNQKSYPPTN